MEMKTADVRRAAIVGGAMLYDASRAGNATAELFEAEQWFARRKASHARAGRGLTLFLDHGTEHWVLRHYHRGGMVAALLADRYFWTGEARARPFREWRLLRDMHAQGLPVPAPVAARYVRSGLVYRGDLITERIIEAPPLSVWLERGRLEREAWHAIGACVRRFHDWGVDHADLNAHNILIDDVGTVWIIDFDRGERRPAGAWRAGNLARLRRSLEKVSRALPADRFGTQDWEALIEGYGPAR